MSFYERRILPWILDLAMRHKEVARYRSLVVPQARGSVLEVGVGSGLNLPFYGEAVERLHAIDPSEPLLRMAGKRARGARFPIDFLARSAEALPLGDEAVDSVVTTFTLCSVGDPEQALREMLRVLKPGGRLLFAEHGLAPDRGVQRWQHRLNPLWKKVAGGCNLDRRIDGLIANAGFRIVDLDAAYARGPRVASYVYAGHAVRAAASGRTERAVDNAAR